MKNASLSKSTVQNKCPYTYKSSKHVELWNICLYAAFGTQDSTRSLI